MSGRTNLKTSLIISLFLVVLPGICGPARAEPIGWSITQLTDNSYNDYTPMVSGPNVVWASLDGNDDEIFFWDGDIITQLTDNSYNDYQCDISGSKVVWAGWDGNDFEIFLFSWDGNTTTQLTDNSYDDLLPRISGSNVTWRGGELVSDHEIFFWDGDPCLPPIQITDNSYQDDKPQISGTNVVWQGYNPNDGDYEIFFWDGNTPSKVTYNTYDDENPQISGWNIVWQGHHGGDYEIFFWDFDPNNPITQVTTNIYDDTYPQISGSNVVWQGSDGGDYEILFWDGDPNNIPTQVTNNSYDDRNPQISGSNVVWEGYDGNDYEIFFWDGTTTTQLTDNSYAEWRPQVSGSNVVWLGWEGTDWEVFMATTVDIHYYVDDDAPNDPGPGDPNISDPCEDGSRNFPFDAIQEAINAATDGNTICVLDGTYTGTGNCDVNFVGKAITVLGWNGPQNCIIDCNGIDRGINFNSAEDGNSVLDGFTIMNGFVSSGAGIYCNGSSPTIRNCVIKDNICSAAPWLGGGGIYCLSSNPKIINCTISNNTATGGGPPSRYGGGLYCKFSNPNIINCTISSNTARNYGGGIYCINDSDPTFSGSTISDNSPDGIALWDANCTLMIAGTVNVISNDVIGLGRLQMDPNASLNVDDAAVFCDMTGVGTMEVEIGAEATIDGNSVIDFGDPCDPNVRGTIDCEGFLRVKDNAQIRNANINITRATFEDDVNVTNCEIHVDSNTPYGHFFIDANTRFTYNDIYANGDRYMHLEPNIFSGLFVYNRIYVTITEGVGRPTGGLFELRGDPNFADPCCDPNKFGCQMGQGNIPDCNLATWTLERLELVEKAKLNFTNRFGFQPPYAAGSDDDVLYVKELVLGPNSVLNTSYNWFYYGTLVGDSNSVTHIPLLGFSLINIALDSWVEFVHRVTHNNYIDPEPDPCDYTRIHVKRVDGNEPDPNGMMQMCTLEDLDPCSLQYQQVISARAKGLFARVGGDEDITIEFEYLFIEDPCDEAELVVYLSDTSKVGESLVEVGRVRPPAPGRPGSIGSGRFALFSGTFQRGSLNFNRGTYVELELRGTNTRCWINNWDPQVNCIAICGNFYEEEDFPLEIVDMYDYFVLLGECGLSNPGGAGKGCLDLIADNCVNADDLRVWGIDDVLNRCGSGSGTSVSAHGVMRGASSTMPKPRAQDIGESAPLLVFGKPPSGIGTYVPGSYLYGVDTNGICVGDAMEPCCPFPSCADSSGRFVADSRGDVYQINGELGLIHQGTGITVVEPNDINDGNNIISVGMSSEEALPLRDAVFKPGKPNIVYVVPVLVTPLSEEGCPYRAAAKLELTGSGNYNILQLYGKNPATDPDQSNIKTDCNDVKGDFVYEPDVQHLHEIDIDSYGNLFILSSNWYNENNWLLIYDESVGNASEVRVLLSDSSDSDPNVIRPAEMVVSSSDAKVYMVSSVRGPGEPNDLKAEVYCFSIDKTGNTATGLTYDKIIEVNCPEPNICSAYPSLCDANLGYITAITSMTENPADGNLYVTGFTAPKLPPHEPLPSEIDEIFTTPMLAGISPAATGLVQAAQIISCDPSARLVLPFSIVSTEVGCGGADFDSSDDISFPDFAIFASAWHSGPGDDNWNPACDISEPGDDFINSRDLAVLAKHWLETGCLD